MSGFPAVLFDKDIGAVHLHKGCWASKGDAMRVLGNSILRVSSHQDLIALSVFKSGSEFFMVTRIRHICMPTCMDTNKQICQLGVKIDWHCQVGVRNAPPVISTSKELN